MISPLIQFIPKKELSRLENLNSFIAYCKNDLTLWSDTPTWEWQNPAWPIRTNNTKIRFTNWGHRNITKNTKLNSFMVMGSAIQDIAKAYIRYRHTRSPHSLMSSEAIAFRLIEAALKADNKDGDITKFNEKHLNYCFELLNVYKAKPSLAAVLLVVLRELAALSIVTTKALLWTNPFIGRSSYAAINGAKASSEVKAGKLPDQNALLALAEIFAKGYEKSVLDDIDVMVIPGAIGP